ncbi:PLP-dependent aminotransferase family protein [Desulfuromonas carbonis]|uniref:aminotransferase-like domain-containing protein n=1 Tax=Desulfuromonas sp. DDH964 TaxID=1823759 RepID=UPI00078C1A53|nr:PLP-dependent aminotransferase family protein [Desulfuromonas sp. DDH964]AMV73640.1 GntR family transcriptional regulator [Desulfuromonas sp. DDH964]
MPEASLPLYEQVAGRIATLVTEGTFRPGERVPSLRRLSRQLQVSLNTVKEAYALLEDRRVLEARPQSGYYVRGRLPEIPAEPKLNPPALAPTEVSTGQLFRMVLRDSLDPQLLPFGIAIPNPDLLPVARLNRMLSEETRRHPLPSVSYAIPPGYERLRQQIAQRMLAAGCALHPEQIVITSGCAEAVALALRALCRPGDTVAIETPVYFNFLQLIEDLQLKTLEIPTSPLTGISLDALDYALESHPGQVKACLVISNFHNPLGGTLGDDDKERLVALLERHGVPLIEDDIYGDLSFSDQRPSVAKAWDKSSNVLLCSSFSKTLAPGYRVGWIASGRYQEQIERAKMITNVATATPPQLAIAAFLANGGYDRHLRSIRRVYARQVAQMADAIGRHFPEGTRVTRPQGGFVLWVEMPAGIDSRRLYERAKRERISIAPGPLFSATGRFGNCLRLNAAFYSEKAEGAVETLGRIAKELVGVGG